MEIVIVNAPTINFSTTQLNNNACAVAGGNYTQSFTTMLIPASGFSLNLYGYSKYGENSPLATLSPKTASSTLTAFFSWQTNCINVKKEPHQIYMVYKSQNQSFYRQFSMKVIPFAPVIYNIISDTNQVILYLNKANTCQPEVKGCNVYRRIGNNSWAPAMCETGTPPNLGFQYLGFVNASDSSFTDNDFSPITNGSTINYIVATAMKDCDESYRSNVKTLNVVVGFPQNELNKHLKIYPNSFSNQLMLEMPSSYSGGLDALIYAVDGSLVFSSDFKSKIWKTLLQLNNLDRGIYLLKLKTDLGIVSKMVIED